MSVVLLYSSLNDLVNIFTFAADQESSVVRTLRHDDMFLFDSLHRDTADSSLSRRIKSLCIDRALTYNEVDNVNESQDADVRFFQIWAVTIDGNLYDSLCVLLPVNIGFRSDVKVEIPTATRHLKNRMQMRVESDMSSSSDSDIDYTTAKQDLQAGFIKSASRIVPLGHRGQTVNWRAVFDFISEQTQIGSESEAIGSLRDRFLSIVQAAQKDEDFALATFHELLDTAYLTIDFDSTVMTMNDLLHRIRDKAGSDMSRNLHLSQLPLANILPHGSGEDFVGRGDLMSIYDSLAGLWLASLPVALSVEARLEKHRMVCRVALQLYLSSLTLHFSLKQGPNLRQHLFANEVPINTTDGGQQPRHVAMQEQSQRMPLLERSFSKSAISTPRRTPSVHSQTSGSQAEELPDLNDALTRLQAYAPSIKSKSISSRVATRLLASWPTEPGTDPSLHTWSPLPGAVAADDSDTDGSQRTVNSQKSQKSQKSQRSQRSSRSQRLWMAGSDLEAHIQGEMPLRPTAGAPPNSQPAALEADIVSSQPTEDMPMTQPDRGNYGSRQEVKDRRKKAKKKRRAAGF